MPINWKEEIQILLTERKLSLRELAKDLEVSNTYLSDVAKGSKPPSNKLKIKIADRRGYDITRDLLIDLLGQEIAEEIRRIEINRGRRRIENQPDSNQTSSTHPHPDHQ